MARLARRVLACWLVALATAGAASAGQNPSRPLQMRIVDFSWPLANGAVVPPGATAVTLDRGMGFTMRFQLPQQCDALHDAGTRYGVDGSREFRAQYDAADAFCTQARVFTRGSASARRDFVSRVDFTVLSLDLVPYEPRCGNPISQESDDLCGRVRMRDASVCAGGGLPPAISYARFVTGHDAATGRMTLDCRPLKVDPVSCRLAKGRFVGDIAVRAGVIRCTQARQGAEAAPGITLVDVTFRDVNSDGIMDAILSVAADAPRPGSQEGTVFSFVLTKRTATTPLERVPLE